MTNYDKTIITNKLETTLDLVNTYSNDLLANDLAKFVSNFDNSDLDQETTKQLINLQEAFQDIYYSLDTQRKFEVNQRGIHSKSKSTKYTVSSMSLSQLKSILSKANSVTDLPQINQLNQIGEVLQNIITLYSILVVYQHISSKLIQSTIHANEQLMYWDNVQNNAVNKWIYLLQVSPLKLYNLARSIINDFKQTLLALSPQDEYLEFQNFQNSKHHKDEWSSVSTEEDNHFFFNYVRIIHLGKLLVNSVMKISQNVMQSLKIPAYSFYKINRSLKSNQNTKLFSHLGIYSKIVLGAPIEIANNEISIKRSKILASIDKAAHGLGLLIHKLPTLENEGSLQNFVNSGTNSNVADIIDIFENILFSQSERTPSNNLNVRLYEVVSKLPDFSTTDTSTKVPTFLVRYWPILLILIKYGPSSTLNIYSSRVEIFQWCKVNLYDTVVGFFKNWVIKPLNDMLGVIRHDDSNAAELSITSKESLQSDLDSLERMVVDYAVDYNISPEMSVLKTSDFKKEIHEAVKEGNLTVLMSQYEKDLRSPYRSLFKGSLPRALLIQLQKTKVDGAMAINGIDKLLKSQQLVFGMVSISPSLIILYQGWNFIKRNISDKPIRVNGKDINLLCLKCLNNIEKYLSIYTEVNQEQQIYLEGYLLIEIINLKLQSLKLLPKSVHEMWIKDLNDINDGEWSIEARLRAMSRIWCVYGNYFRRC